MCKRKGIINENSYLSKYNKKKSLTLYGNICKINLQIMEIEVGRCHMIIDKETIVKNGCS